MEFIFSRPYRSKCVQGNALPDAEYRIATNLKLVFEQKFAFTDLIQKKNFVNFCGEILTFNSIVYIRDNTQL